MTESALNYRRSREVALVAAEACKRILKEQFGAREVYLVGSLAGQGPWHGASDIDLAVEGLDPEKYISALSVLSEVLPEDMDLDLITLEDAPPEFLSRVRGEVPMPHDNKAALQVEMNDELTYLTRLVEHLKVLLSRVPAEPTFVETNAAGKILHDFYCGVERIFERIAVRLGPGLPSGENWHTALLRTMESEVPGIRAAVIDHGTASSLVDYLRFRHLFRHTYGFELEWAKLDPLVRNLENTQERLKGQLKKFLEAV